MRLCASAQNATFSDDGRMFRLKPAAEIAPDG